MPGRDRARQLDEADPLARQRKRFVIPDDIIYLDGDSLGPLPAGVAEAVQAVIVEQWGGHLIRAWNEDDWFTAPLRLGDRIARLLGAAPGQTVVGDSTSVQLFNALVAAARLRPGRTVLLVETGAFPTDRYLAGSAARLLGLEIHEVPAPRLADALDRLGERVAVVLAAPVDYRTGELCDLPRLTAHVHRAGAVGVWDLCHAVGSIPLALDADRVDLAVGCTYKYLSGGPGAPAFLYVATRHQDRFDQPLVGWLGHARPFDGQAGYEPAPGIARARVGTPPILSMLALEAALDAFDGVDIEMLRAKNVSLGDFFIECADDRLAALGFEVVTPRAGRRRGSHISLRHPQARPMMAALIERGVIGDVRSPDLLRFGFNGLFLSHADVFDGVDTLRQVAESGAWRAARFQIRKTVE